MLGLSYVFYGWVGWSYCLLLVATTTIAFIGGAAVSATTTEQCRRLAMALSCAALLGLLGWFKYYGFVSVNLDNFTHVLGLGRAVPLLPGGAAHRHLVLHVHGAELRDRHLPSPAGAGPPVGPGSLPVLLPPPAGGADRAGRRAPAPAAPPARSAGRRLLARPVADHGRPLQEGGDLLLRLDRHRPARLHGTGPALGARGDLRRLGLRGADLLRLQRVHRHRHRTGAPPRHPLPDQLRRALHGAEPAGLLASLAHHALAVAARLPLHPARREQRVRGADGAQRHDHHGARGSVARRGVDLRVLGGACTESGRRSGTCAAGAGCSEGCRRWPTVRCAYGCSGS